MQQHRLARRLLALIFILSTFTVIFSTTPLPASSTPQTQVQIIESDDPLVLQEGSWTSQNTPQASGGKYLYSSGSTSDVLTLEFTGTSIDIYYVTHSTFGSFAIEIDNNIRRTVVTTSKETTFGNIATVNYLDDTPHTLRVYPVEGVVAIDAFYATPHIQSVEEGSATSALSSSVRFIPNMGQFDDEVRFEAQGANGTAYYTDNEVVLVLPVPPESTEFTEPPLGPDERSTEETVPDVVRMHFEGTNTNPNILSLQRLPGEVNYFIGNDDTDWYTNVPIYGAIHYEDLYPGVDVIFDETSGALQGTFTIDGGIDLSQIRWRYEGATNLRIDEVTGELLFDVVPNAARTAQVESTTPAQHRQPAPSAWQETGGQRTATSIDLQYAINEDGTVGFTAQGYNAAQPLTIAPLSGGMMEAALIIEEPSSEIGFSSYLGGSTSMDYISDVAADSSGNMYVTGNMPSTVISGGIIGYGGNNSAFVAKFNGNNTLDFITYFGGSSGAYGTGIALDSSSNIYLTGYTGATNFPVLNAYQSTCTTQGGGCAHEVYIIKISSSGDTLLYGTYLGDASVDEAYAIVADDNNQVYVTGLASSAVLSWNDCTDACSDQVVGWDAFLVKLDLDKTGSAQLEYGRTFGGSGVKRLNDYGTDIALDTQGNVVVVGYTETHDFLEGYTGVLQPYCLVNQLNDCIDGFVTRFIPATGDTLELNTSTYLGGTLSSQPTHNVAIGADGYIYVVGSTNSTNFPVIDGAFTTNTGTDYDAFLVKMSSDLSAVVYGTYLGGSGNDFGYGVDVNTAGIAYVTGTTQSTDFPTTPNAIDETNNGSYDMFLARIDTNQTGLDSLLESTYWGGSNVDYAYGVAESNGTFYIAGDTYSDDLPIVNGYQTGFGGSQDGFMMRGSNLTCTFYVNNSDNSIADIKRFPEFDHFNYQPGQGPYALKIFLDQHRNEIISNGGIWTDLDQEFEEEDLQENVPDYILEIENYRRMSNYTTEGVSGEERYYLLSYYLHEDFNIAIVNYGPYTLQPKVIFTGVGFKFDDEDNCQTIPTTPDREKTIEILQYTYSIEIEEDGQAWEPVELRSILTGVLRVSAAFQEVGAVEDSIGNTFETIMVNPGSQIRFLRLGVNPPQSQDLSYYYTNTEFGKCSYHDSGVSGPNSPPTIVCRGSMTGSIEWNPDGFVTTEAVVHELGHVFDSRFPITVDIGGQPTNTTELRDAIQNDLTGDFALNDNPDEQPLVLVNCGFRVDQVTGEYQDDPPVPNVEGKGTVMGIYGAGWTRGSTGWGSVHGTSNFSRFQQNGSDTVEETVADMFLNWVFRRTSSVDPVPLSGNACDGPNNIGNWEGFLNIQRVDGNEAFDPQLGGNVRYWWMDSQVISLLDEHDWR